MLTDPAVQPKLADTKAACEVRALEDFFEMMKVDPDRAIYGLSDINVANARMAIQTLMITDELFRCEEEHIKFNKDHACILLAEAR